ncbi:MAG: PspC domain-containing protein [Candidatus Pacebacteria bacterium]|nr:PspC domain-containing protein [Candidatus Paceibacterota bacterium]
MKKIYRSEENKIFKGIVGGIGEYVNVDPVLLRIIVIFFVLSTGVVPGILTYLLAIMIIPKQSVVHTTAKEV